MIRMNLQLFASGSGGGRGGRSRGGSGRLTSAGKRMARSTRGNTGRRYSFRTGRNSMRIGQDNDLPF